RLERRQSHGSRGVFDRHRESDPYEHVLLGWIEDRSDDADDFAVGGDERSTRAARVRRSVELDQIGQQALAFGGTVFALEAGDDAGRDGRSDAEGKSHSYHMIA